MTKKSKNKTIIIDILLIFSVYIFFSLFTSAPISFFMTCSVAMVLIIYQETPEFKNFLWFRIILIFAFMVNTIMIFSFDFGERTDYTLLIGQTFVFQAIALYYLIKKIGSRISRKNE